MLLVVDNTELSGSNTLNEMVGMDETTTIFYLFQMRMMKFWRMTNLESNFGRQFRCSEMMEIVKTELLCTSFLWLIAFRHIKHVLGNVFLNDIPRAAAKT